MPIIITEIGLLNASYFLTRNTRELNNSITRLSEGSALAIPSEDPGGVAVSARLESRILRLEAASDNAQSAISLAQTLDGFLTTIQEQLTRMSELAIQATNGSFGSSDLANYNNEFTTLRIQIGNITSNARFDDITLFTAATLSFGISADAALDTFITSTVGNTGSLGISTLTIGTTTAATSAVNAVSAALVTLSSRRAQVNADISKFNFHISNIGYETLATRIAQSAITDLDVATETTRLTRNQIAVQSATSVIAQANLIAEDVLTLLRS